MLPWKLPKLKLLQLFLGPAIQIHSSASGQDQQNQNAHLLVYNKSSHFFILADQLKNMILEKHIEVRITVTTKLKWKKPRAVRNISTKPW